MPGDPSPTNPNVMLREARDSVFVNASELPWVEVPQSQGTMHFKLLRIDREANGATFVMKFAPGVQLDVHRHVGPAELLVLKGGFTYWGRTLVPDGYGYEGDGTVHQPEPIAEELTMFIRTGPVREYAADGSETELTGGFDFYLDAWVAAGAPTEHLKLGER
jgi:anti-sigma factor ChrR (cupin superfamily)